MLIDGPMRRALELAWEAYAARSFPVGAVVVDAAGVIIAEGRNRIGDSAAPPGRLCNTALAHAEIDALAQLPPGRYDGHTLYTSLEPCLLCRSAAVMCGVGTVRYLGCDALWRGLDRIVELNDHTANRHPLIVGPGDGLYARFASVLPLAVLCSFEPDGPSMMAHRLHSSNDAAVAQQIVSESLWPSSHLGLDAAVEALRHLFVDD